MEELQAVTLPYYRCLMTWFLEAKTIGMYHLFLEVRIGLPLAAF